MRAVYQGLRRVRGQATVEAAALLPTLTLLLGLLLQPVCLSYTKAVMNEAAAECARAAVTAYGGDLESCRAYALRRLGAVPDVPLFHVGGAQDWDVEIACSDGTVEVGITGHVRPLPLLGVWASFVLPRDDTGIVLRATLTEELRPSWLGGSYGDWQSVWG